MYSVRIPCFTSMVHCHPYLHLDETWNVIEWLNVCSPSIMIISSFSQVRRPYSVHSQASWSHSIAAATVDNQDPRALPERKLALTNWSRVICQSWRLRSLCEQRQLHWGQIRSWREAKPRDLFSSSFWLNSVSMSSGKTRAGTVLH